MTGRKLWWGVLLVIFLAGAAWGQIVRVMPVPPHVKPSWTRMPETPRVFYAPNVPADVFRGPGGYYLLLDSTWYRSRMLNGPWRMMHQVPPFLSYINPSYFKSARARPPKKPAVPTAPVTPPAAAPPATAGLAGIAPTTPATPQAGGPAPPTPSPGAQATLSTPAATTSPTAATSEPDTAMTPAPAPEPIFVYDPGPP